MINRETNEDDSAATIVSNDGWDSVRLVFIQTLELGQTRLVLTKLEMSGSFWGRQESLTSMQNADLRADYAVYLPQVLISEVGMREWIERLQGWMSTYARIDFQLSQVEDQTLFVSLGESAEVISRPDHPLFTLRYCSSRMDVEIRFVTDPSCVNSFLQGLLKTLANT